MTKRFIFDIEAIDLYDASHFAYGLVVIEENETTKELKILEEEQCFCLEGIDKSCEYVIEQVLPVLHELHPYLEIDTAQKTCRLKVNLATIDPTTLPNNIVITQKELRDRFFKTYSRWYQQGIECWSDVLFPVESTFLSKVIHDDIKNRFHFSPYPFMDVVHFVDIKKERIEYSKLSGLLKHRPLDDAKASAFSLYRGIKEYKHPYLQSDLKGKKLTRFIFDAGAQDLHDPAFGYGYVLSQLDLETFEFKILKIGQCYSVASAKLAGDYVRQNSLPHLKFLHPYLELSSEELSSQLFSKHLVYSLEELIKKFYKIYQLYKNLGVELWAADVKFPVETNLLMLFKKMNFGNPDIYPLLDVSSVVDVNISRADFSGLNEIKKGHPLHHAITSSCALHLTEIASLPIAAEKKEKITQHIRSAYQQCINDDNLEMQKFCRPTQKYNFWQQPVISSTFKQNEKEKNTASYK